MLETFPDEQLFSINKVVPWYTNIVNYLVGKVLPFDFSRAQKEKLKHDVKYYIWNDPYL